MPERVRQLGPLNALLAHQPWRVTKEMISELTRKHKSSSPRNNNNNNNNHHDGDSSSSKPWLISHLVHAVVILCQHHLAAAMVLTLGVQHDADMQTVRVCVSAWHRS